MQQRQHAPMTDHDHAERVKRLASALNAAVRGAAGAGLQVEVGIVSVHTNGLTHEAPQLDARVVRQVEVG